MCKYKRKREILMREKGKERERERERRNTGEREKARLIYKRSSSGWTKVSFFFIIVCS